MKAKAILAPADNDGLEAVFYNFCGVGHSDMDGKGFKKLCQDCSLIDKKLDTTSVDLIFADNRVKARGTNRIDFFQFEIALELLAEKKGTNKTDVRAAMIQQGVPKTSNATVAVKTLKVVRPKDNARLISEKRIAAILRRSPRELGKETWKKEIKCQGANLTRFFTIWATQSPWAEVQQGGRTVGRTRPHQGGDKNPRWDDPPFVVDPSKGELQFRVLVPSSSVMGHKEVLCGEGVVAIPDLLRQAGHVPPPPSFAGDIEADPYCLRHYKKALGRWQMITQEFLPRNEQALRALDALTDAAALEVEEVSDDRYNCDRGLELLIEDLSVAFCEKELFRRGGLIREYESLTRMQGESVTAFVRRFRLYERKLKDAKLEPYPDETRAIKLLDGLKLDERATSSLLLAATNRYNFDPLIEAIRVQYPAVLTLPDGIVYETVPEDLVQFEAEPDDDPLDYQYGEEEELYEDEAIEALQDEEQPNEPYEADNTEEHQAMTATSKRLASTVQSRGYYTSASKGKGKGKSPKQSRD
eukprot:g2660.t1